MRMTRWLVAFVMLCVAGLAQAEQGSKALQGFYKKVNTLSADFQQVQRDDNGNVVQQASGTFLLSRPKKFRWEYKQPYKQIILSNGKVFKFYDVDLAQVTIRDIGATLKATPALLLTGGEALNDAFHITDGGQHDGMTWVHLDAQEQGHRFQIRRSGLEERRAGPDGAARQSRPDHRISFGNVKINPNLRGFEIHAEGAAITWKWWTAPRMAGRAPRVETPAAGTAESGSRWASCFCAIFIYGCLMPNPPAEPGIPYFDKFEHSPPIWCWAPGSARFLGRTPLRVLIALSVFGGVYRDRAVGQRLSRRRSAGLARRYRGGRDRARGFGASSTWTG